MTAFTPISKAFLLSNQSLIGDALLPPGQGIFFDLATLNVIAGSSSIGYYDGSLAALGLGAGLILTSGTMPGTANTVTYFGQNNGMAGDAMLDAVVNTVFPTVSLDATTLSVDFTVTDPTITSISFNIVFGSDEYPEWVNQYVDIAAIWVNGQDYAYFNNDPHAPLSVIGGNLAANYFIDNTGNLTNPAGFGGTAIPGAASLLPIEYDGVSAPLTVTAPVHFGLNTLKIGIADTRDHIYDSGIIISNMRGGTVPYTGITRDVDGSEVNDDLEGTDTPETLQGKGGDDAIYGRGGNDVVQAGDGDDYIVGGAGNDYIQGGLGTDTANYSGLASDYTIVANADGSYTVTDNRAGALDGEDTLVGVENIQFADVALNLATGEAIAQVLAPVAQVAPPPPPPVAPPPPLLPAAIDAVLVSTTEDAEPAEAGAFANVLVLDDSALSVVDLPATLPAGVTFNSTNHAFYLDTGDAAYQSLAMGETATVTVNYGVSNGVATSPASVVFTVTGTNDAPTVSGAATVAVTEGDASASVDALANAADVDNGAVLSVVALPVVVVPASATNGNGSGGHGADDAAAPGPVGATVGYGLNTLPAGVSYDLQTNMFSIDPADAAFAYLSLGQTANVVVNYGVTDGTAVTAASVTFTVTGTNSAPVVSGPAIVNALEGSGGAAMGRAALLAHVTDVDANDTLDLVISEADLPEGVLYNHTPGATIVTNIPAFSYYGYNIPGGVFVTTILPTDTLTLDTSNATFDHLAEGQSLDFVVGYSVSDGHISTPAQAIFHLTGVNDAPVVTSPVAGAATEGAGIATIDALANASDVDDGTMLIVCALPAPSGEAENVFNAAGVIEKALPPPPPILPFDPATLPAGVSYDALTHSFSLNANDPAFGSLAAGQTTTVTVNYGVSDGIVITSATAVFTVTGTNNAPIVSGPVTGLFVNEGGAIAAFDNAALLSNSHDPDTGDILTVTIEASQLPEGVTYVHTPEVFIPGHTTPAYVIPAGPRATGWGNYVYPAEYVPAVVVPDVTIPATTTLNIDPSNAAYQHLAQGAEQELTVHYTVSDGTFSVETSAILTVNGMNDAPVVAGDVLAAATEGGAAVTVDALANASDVDDGAVLTLVAKPVPVAPVFDNQHDQAESIALAAAAPIPAQPFDPSALPAGVTYDVANHAFTLDPADAAYRYLAQGQTARVVVEYGVSDGYTVTAGKTVFTVTGTNSAPVVSGPVRLTVYEDGASAGFKTTTAAAPASPGLNGKSADDASASTISALNVVDMLANASDVDTLDKLSVTGVQTPLPAGVFTTQVPGGYYQPDILTYAIRTTDASLQSLALGETMDVTVNYQVTDGIASTAAQAIFTVIGANDAPVVATPAKASAVEDGGIVALDALATATDVDHGAVLSVVNVPAVLPAGVSYDAASHSFSLDPSVAAYQALSAGQTQTATIAYAVTDGIATTPATAVFTVTGTNDLPVVSGSQAYTVTAGGAAFTLNPMANVTDVDSKDVLRLLPGPLATGVHTVLVPGGYYLPDVQIAQFFPNDPAFRHLAQGAVETVTWTYGVTDGTATVADSIAFTVTGVNDAPVILSTAGGVATEDGAVQTVDVLANAIDYDDGAVLSIVNVQTVLPAGVTYDAATHSFALNPADASFQALAQGETQSVAVSYGVTDGTATTMGTVQWTVVGVNDAPIVSGPVTSTPNEGSGIVSINAVGNATDVDEHKGLHVSGLQAVLPAGLTFDGATDRFLFDSDNAAYDSLSAGESLNLTVTYNVTDGYVEVPASATISVQGKNDAPTVNGAVQGGTILAGASPVSLSLLSNVTDVDHLDVLSVVSGKGANPTVAVTSGSWASPVSFAVANNQLSLNPAQFAALGTGKSVGLTFSYQVTDGKGGVAVADTATMTIQGTYAGPSGVAVTPLTSSLGKLIGGSGLNAKQPLATMAQIGGLASGSYSYTVGGAGAGSFAIATSSGVAQLQTGTSGAAGAAGGKLYALTVSTTDTTAGISSAAAAVNVVVGGGKSGDTINLASLPGMVASAPSFVYDLGGADTVNGAGMTGKLWIEGGQGADVMTGGSGPNTFLYGATADSTATAMDIVTNFHASVDVLDFTGLGTKFANIVALASNATTIAGGAIGWQVSGNNTFVYVNTSGNSQNLTSAAMKVELLGNVGLTAANIAHL